MRTQHPEEGFAYLSEKAHKVLFNFLEMIYFYLLSLEHSLGCETPPPEQRRAHDLGREWGDELVQVPLSI